MDISQNIKTFIWPIYRTINMINHKYRLFQKYTENDFTKEIGNWWINIKEAESVFWDESVFNVDGITNYDFFTYEYRRLCR